MMIKILKSSVVLTLLLRVSFFMAGFFLTMPVSGQTEGENNTGTRSIRTANEGFAEEEFRRGVQAYYRGSFNDAILQFEKALSYVPGENRILDWLGKAYYRAGIEGAALEQWQFASDAGYGGLLLQNRIEIVRDRRITGADQEASLRYTESGSFPGVRGKNMIFGQPVSVLPDADGTFWLLAYGSNELLKFDVNGTVINRITGPVNGFDRPVDVIRLHDGRFLVSESAGDRLSVLNAQGRFEKYIGEKGRGNGQMVGPQYLAQDIFGNIYVTDFGNCRVDVFDRNGKALFFFGMKTDRFAGLQGPTGIAVLDERVFVADCVTGAVYEFDRSGNYTGALTEEKTFKHPESLKNWGNYLLACDSNRIVSIDTSTGAVFENARTGNAPSRLMTAVPDSNGNMLVTDLRSNELYIMSKMTELVGGLFVQIEQVNADSFPDVTMEVRVENRHRQPVVGLRDGNFFVTENKRPVMGMKLEAAASNNRLADITLLIDRSADTDGYRDELQSAVRELAASMAGQGTLRIVSAGEIPVTEYTGTPAGAVNFDPVGLKTPVSSNVAVDLAVRLAANDLIKGEKKRAIIYLTAGTVSQLAFTKYGLSDLTAYLNNNSVIFSVVQLAQQAPAEEINYLCTNTMGNSYYVYRPQGLASVIHDIIAIPNGLYRISYKSALPANFGQAYLPVETEIYLLNRSGRDESGYYAPLQ
jgi:DNA-binding beta-propeller fold protein YncE